MNVSVEGNERLALRDPVSQPDDHVPLRALLDCYVIFSARPMDITPVNGGSTPRAAHYEVID